jgi:hypothetical protein
LVAEVLNRAAKMGLLKLLQFIRRDSPASANTKRTNAPGSAKGANRLRGQLEMRRGLFRCEEDLTDWLSAAIAWSWLFHCFILNHSGCERALALAQGEQMRGTR